PPCAHTDAPHTLRDITAQINRLALADPEQAMPPEPHPPPPPGARSHCHSLSSLSALCLKLMAA
ncbi:hypothetical protein KUCAC02_005086, partial [Chaenocephalus aceratus]